MKSNHYLNGTGRPPRFELHSPQLRLVQGDQDFIDRQHAAKQLQASEFGRLIRVTDPSRFVRYVAKRYTVQDLRIALGNLPQVCQLLDETDLGCFLTGPRRRPLPLVAPGYTHAGFVG